MPKPPPPQQQQQQQSSVRNQNQTTDNFQQTPDSNKVRIKKMFVWIRENFFLPNSDFDSDTEDEEEKQAVKEEKRLIKHPPIIKPELRVGSEYLY